MVVKRNQANQSKAIIIDIEGTVTSISFVKETLFPYVKENLAEYVLRKWNEPEFQEDLSLLRDQCLHDASLGMEGFVPIPNEGNDSDLQEAVVNNVLWQMNLDAKNVALKQLQGHIMREGYKKGQLKGHVFEDVLPALQSWTQSGLKLYVYSSGSVEAQKLLFGHSEKGDLLELFSGHFDTEVGGKIESSSYSKIAKQLEYQPDEMVFFTDIPKEAAAAETVGMTAVLVVRDGNAALSDEDHLKFRVIHSLSDFDWESSVKRRKISVEDELLPTEDKLLVDSQPVSATKTDDITDDVEMQEQPMADNNKADSNDAKGEGKREICNEIIVSSEEPVKEAVVGNDKLSETVVCNTVFAIVDAVHAPTSILKKDSKLEDKETLPEESEVHVIVKDISVVHDVEEKPAETEISAKSPTIMEQVDMAGKDISVDESKMEEVAIEPVVTELLEPESHIVAKQIPLVENMEEKSEEKEILPEGPTIKEQQVTDEAEKEILMDESGIKEVPIEPVVTELLEPESHIVAQQIPLAENVEEKSEEKEILLESPIIKGQQDVAEKEILVDESEMKEVVIEPGMSGVLEPQPSVAENLIVTDESGSELKEISGEAGVLETESTSGQASTEEEIMPLEAELKDKSVEQVRDKSEVTEHLASAVPNNIFAIKTDNQKLVISEALDEPKSDCKSDVNEPEKENLPEDAELKESAIDPIVMGVDKTTDKIEIGQGDNIEN